MLLDTQEIKPHIIAITEAENKVKADISLSEFSIIGYSITANNQLKDNRGIILITRRDVKFIETAPIDDFEEIMIISIEAKKW